MTTTENTIDRLELVLARLERLGGSTLEAAPSPLAAGDLPARVAAGELIQSAWGNGVVDAVTLNRTNGRDVSWSIPQVSAGAAGTYDLGPVIGGPGVALAYPATVTIVMAMAHGATTTGPGQGRGELFRFLDNSPMFLGSVPNSLGLWTVTPLVWTYNVAAGQAWGAKARITVDVPGGSYSAAANGFYRIQRTS